MVARGCGRTQDGYSGAAVRGFRLTKWYLDCVEPDGATTIAYVSDLCWRGITFRYASVLRHADGRTTTRTSLLRAEPPTVRGRVLRWSSARLGTSGTWRSLSSPVTETLLATRAGQVEWTCLQPAARVSTRDAERDAPAAGLGYAECLVTTIAPWRLPIRELHWGRFVSLDARSSLVWIDWRGDHAVRLAVRDGVRFGAEVNADRIALEDGAVLGLDQRDVLREGTIGSTVLRATPRLRTAVPRGILGVHECKWRSRGVLAVPGARAVEGWAVHEVVNFP